MKTTNFTPFRGYVCSFAALELPVITVGVHDSTIRARKAVQSVKDRFGIAIEEIAAA